MDIDFINIVTVLSVIVTIVFLICTISEVRKENKQKKDLVSNIRIEMTDYEKISQATYGIEKAREKNKGIHLDEDVYLNRANEIRKTSSLFNWINEC